MPRQWRKEQWRKGQWCLQCWEECHCQKSVAYEALTLSRFLCWFAGTEDFNPLYAAIRASKHELDQAFVPCDPNVACPWVLLGEHRVAKAWYWAPQPKSLWNISFMTKTIVQKTQTTSFKHVCATDGLMLVINNGKPALCCVVCGAFANHTHFNHSHKTMCTQFTFSRARRIVLRPGHDEDGLEYTTTLLDFYEELTLFPPDWGKETVYYWENTAPT